MKKMIMPIAVLLAAFMLLSACGAPSAKTESVQRGTEPQSSAAVPAQAETLAPAESEQVPAVSLTEEELRKFTELFATREYNGFLAEGFRDAEDIGWSAVLRDGGGIAVTEVSEEEIAEYLKATGQGKLYADLYVLRRGDLLAFAKRHTGTEHGFEERDLPDWDYIPENDSFYRLHWYDEGMVFKFGYEDERLTITPVKGEEIKAFMGEYKAMDDYVMHNDALVPLDEDKQQLLVSVDSTQSMAYVLLRSYKEPVDTLEHHSAFVFDQTYPFNLFTSPLSDTIQSVVVYCDFDVFIPRTDDDARKITLGFAIDRADGHRELLKTLVINYDWYEYYDQWQHYSMTQTFSRAQVNYLDGEKLMCYFANAGQRTFVVSDFKLKVVGLVN